MLMYIIVIFNIQAISINILIANKKDVANDINHVFTNAFWFLIFSEEIVYRSQRSLAAH